MIGHGFVVRMCIAAAMTWLSVAACAQSVATAAPPLPADPWPRSITLSNAAVLVYQPQVTSWDGHRIEFRSALAIKPAGAKEETFGVIFATARTEVDKVDRTVVFEDLQVSKSEFPTLPDHGAAFKSELQTRLAGDLRTISLDRLQASLVAAGGKVASIGVDNTPPQIFVSNRPAILVPVDGAPVLKAIAHHARYQRVINTRALIVQDTRDSTYYLHVYDGWLASTSLSGPWSQAFRGPVMEHELTAIATELSASGAVDLLDGGPKAKPRLSLQQMVPTIDVSQGAAELVVFDGQPDFVPVVGTQLLWASNTTSDVLIDIASNRYYLLLAGRWFTSAALSGPWTFVASNALPADFARIPPHSLAGAVLPSVSGTPQAREAVIANSIPQSATVPLRNGPKFTPNFDGPPQYAAVAGTSLSYVVNSSEPVIRVDPDAWYAVVAGVWFTAAQVTGPWTVATSVPAVIYTIPPSSPLHYVTYVRIYEATPQYVYAGYTPGYLGVVVEPSGTIVYGTGFAYAPWIGSVWYPGPVTYTVAAAPIYNPYVGFTFGFAVGLATAAWYAPYYGGFYGAYYHPAYWGGYGCCASGSANVYGHWGNAAYSGTRSWYAGGGVAGTTFSGSYANARTGTSGNINAGKQFNAWTGNATRGYDRTINGAGGGAANVARAGNDNLYTGQRSTASGVAGVAANGSTYQRAGATTSGPLGYAHAGGGTLNNATTGKSDTWSTASLGNNHYADVNGNVYRNNGSGWEQHGSGGWNSAGGDTSWADREAQSRSDGDDRSGSFSSEADRFGGGGFDGARSGGFGGGNGGNRFAGGGGWGGRFGGGGGGGFGGGGFRGGRR
ncbi:MAG TPA: carbohydrate-binding family V/XII [Casimicrobiaceae bacterium]|nr:carbohydrate-binding family V/XII [Casimicrobiaceae bacterium]